MEPKKLKDLDHNENHPRIKEVETIIERLDKGRFDYRGGYPSDWIIAGDFLIMASLDHKDGPELTIQKVSEFIEEHDWALAP